MSANAMDLLARALQLPEKERGELAARLIESLETGADEGAEAAWSEEIKKRVEELQSGQAKGVPWPEARALILKDDDDPAAT
jgi:putative addiction module component (TIGR02574 family)